MAYICIENLIIVILQGGRGVEILLVASCYGNQDKLQPDGPLGSYAEFFLGILFYQCYFSNVFLPSLAHFSFRASFFASKGQKPETLFLRLTSSFVSFSDRRSKGNGDSTRTSEVANRTSIW